MLPGVHVTRVTHEARQHDGGLTNDINLLHQRANTPPAANIAHARRTSHYFGQRRHDRGGTMAVCKLANCVVERLHADSNIPRIGVPDMVVVIATWHCASRFSFALDVLVTHLMHADHRVYYVWIRATEASVPPAVREVRWGAKKVSSRRQIDSSSARRPDRTPAQLMAGNEQTQQIAAEAWSTSIDTSIRVRSLFVALKQQQVSGVRDRLVIAQAPILEETGSARSCRAARVGVQRFTTQLQTLLAPIM